MAMNFKDFFPSTTKTGLFSKKQEILGETVARANAWISSSSVRVINVETVVFPNIDAEQSSKADSVTRGDFLTEWHQLIRVWYEDSTPIA